MSNEQRLGGERVRLHLHVCPGDLVDEAGLAHVGEARDQDGAGVGVDRGQTGQVLADLKNIGWCFFRFFRSSIRCIKDSQCMTFAA